MHSRGLKNFFKPPDDLSMKPANLGVDIIVLVLILATFSAEAQPFQVKARSPLKGSERLLHTTRPFELEQEMSSCEMCSCVTRPLKVKYDQERLCRVCSVVSHPHPAAFFAGSGSENGYVTFMAEAMGRAGVCTARFDFRSSGFLSQGGDMQDYVEVMHRVRRKLGCMRGFINAGYSYGSAIAHGAMSVAQNEFNILGYIGLAPPWSVGIFGDHYETQWTMSQNVEVPRIFIFGSKDDWCSKKRRDHYAKVFVEPSAKFVALPGGDHFSPVTEKNSEYLMLAIKTGVKSVLAYNGLK